MKKASILSRILAGLVDIYLGVFIAIISIALLLNWFEDNFVLSFILSLISILIGLAAALFKDVVNGRSIGKRIFNLCVRELDHSVPSTKKLVYRNLSSLFWPKDIYNLLFSNDKRKKGDIRNDTDVYRIVNTGSKATKALRIMISISIILFFIGGIFAMIKQDASYKAAIAYIKNDESIQEKVGDNISFGFFSSGSISRSNGYGKASFKIKVSGDKDRL